ncbi:MAG TPA: hypothetical protein V6C99_07190 [Oculatellaceae cyanobacterium]|jgi:hypothetical protein
MSPLYFQNYPLRGCFGATDSGQSLRQPALGDASSPVDSGKEPEKSPATEHSDKDSLKLSEKRKDPIEQSFSPFIRLPSPAPVPSKWQFFWSELKANYQPTLEEGEAQYKEALRKDEHTLMKAVGIATVTAASLTVFRRLRRTGVFLLLMALLGKPIMVATQAFPKMSEAYEEVKRGNPNKGRAQFREALDESVYTIFKDFFKPVSYGVLLAYALELPFVFRNEGAGIRHQIIRKVADVLRIKRDAKPIVWLHEKMKPSVYWGDRQANRLRKKAPLIDWIEDPKHPDNLPLRIKIAAERAQREVRTLRVKTALMASKRA